MNQTTALQDLLQEVMATVNYIKGADEEFYKGQVDAYQNVVDAIEALMPKDRETHYSFSQNIDPIPDNVKDFVFTKIFPTHPTNK
jgi:hypothetical protein